MCRYFHLTKRRERSYFAAKEELKIKKGKRTTTRPRRTTTIKTHKFWLKKDFFIIFFSVERK